MKLKNMYKHLHKAFPDNKIYERHMFRGAEGLGRIDNLLPISPYVLSKYDEYPVVRLDCEENINGEKVYFIVISTID